MPRKCSVCKDKRRMEIGEAIVAGEAENGGAKIDHVAA